MRYSTVHSLVSASRLFALPDSSRWSEGASKVTMQPKVPFSSRSTAGSSNQFSPHYAPPRRRSRAAYDHEQQRGVGRDSYNNATLPALGGGREQEIYKPSRLNYPQQSLNVDSIYREMEGFYSSTSERRALHDPIAGDTNAKASAGISERQPTSYSSGKWSHLRPYKEGTRRSLPTHSEVSLGRADTTPMVFSDPYDVGSVTTGMSQQELIRRKVRESTKKQKSRYSTKKKKKNIVQILPSSLLGGGLRARNSENNKNSLNIRYCLSPFAVDKSSR
jgi:hypothetical protein